VQQYCFGLLVCRFGTFLYDCQQERVAAQVQSKTLPLWSFLNFQPRFINASYRPNATVSCTTGSGTEAGAKNIAPAGSCLVNRPVASVYRDQPTVIGLDDFLRPRTGARDIQLWMRFHVSHAFPAVDPALEDMDNRNADHLTHKLYEQQTVLMARTKQAMQTEQALSNNAMQ
jgi:hypothetical protein